MSQLRVSFFSAAVLCALLFNSNIAVAQSYQPYWRDNGMVAFLRPLNDSTVIELQVQHAPTQGMVTLGVFFMAWRVQCSAGEGKRMSIGMVPASGNSEAGLLEEMRSARGTIRMETPSFGFEERDGSRLLAACIATSDARRASNRR